MTIRPESAMRHGLRGEAEALWAVEAHFLGRDRPYDVEIGADPENRRRALAGEEGREGRYRVARDPRLQGNEEDRRVPAAGFAKFIVVKKPATKERQGINPFTKEPTVFKAKPARKS